MKNDEIKIVNMVISVDFADRIDLDKVANELENTEYQPEQFPGLVYRVKNPKSAVLIFSSGKMNCTGTKSMKDARKVIRIVIKDAKTLGFITKKPKIITIQNIVAVADLGKKVDLDKVLQFDNTEYEPAQFPGLVYRMKEPKVAFLIFTSGKIVETGARDEEMMVDAYKKLKKKMKEIGALKNQGM